MPTIAEQFAAPHTASLSRPAARLVRASRLWVALARRGHNPRACLRPLLGPAEPAFCQFMERLVAAWPDPFAALPPCATFLSADEATVAGLFEAALAARPQAAEALLADLLATDERRRLWQAASAVTHGLAEEA